MSKSVKSIAKNFEINLDVKSARVEADCPQDGAFKISKWNKFDLSSIC